MSFAKAKRFNYKAPDIDVSPADYDVSTSLEKGCGIGKCPRYQKNLLKEEKMSVFVCSRLSCSQRSDSSPSTQMKNKDHSNQFDRSLLNRSSVRQNSSKNQKPKSDPRIRRENDENKNPNVRMLVDKFENIPSSLGFAGREEFIDDDYHSFTSSEELEKLYKIEEYELEEVCRALEKINTQDRMRKNKRDKTFEEKVLEKMEKIERNVEQFKRKLAILSGKAQTDYLQKQHDRDVARIETVRTYLNSEDKTLSRQKHDEIKDIIARAIQNLGDEFENKRKSILRHSEEKIQKLMKEIYLTSSNSTEEINEICRATSSDLTKKLTKVWCRSNVPALEFESSRYFDEMAKEVEKTCVDEGDSYFNYENICKVLSDHLQNSKDELDILEQDKLDITLKFGETQKALEGQASIINMLHNEITSLKEYVGGK
ncbi:hypothetical protein JTB14_021953 [Gonioctena quinquepunctata]|nr:hypothetical protein JTB14_021953 [Gonioctena quinquepunctata]